MAQKEEIYLDDDDDQKYSTKSKLLHIEDETMETSTQYLG
jgi:hypothetical protein